MLQQCICTSLAILLQDLVPQLSLVYPMDFPPGLSELWVPSRVLGDHDERKVVKATEVIKKALWANSSALITKSEGLPVLYSYSSDGTRLTTTTTLSGRCGLCEDPKEWQHFARVPPASWLPQDHQFFRSAYSIMTDA